MASTRKSPTHCVHAWAHNTEPDGRKTSGNMSYRGMRAYSYATTVAVKYPRNAARPWRASVEPELGTCVVAGDGIRNSSSTCTHKSSFTRALPGGWDVITVDIPFTGYHSGDAGGALASVKGLKICHKHMLGKLKELAGVVKVAKRDDSRAKAWQEFFRYSAGVNQLAAFLKLKARAPEAFGLDIVAEQTNLAAHLARAGEKRLARDAVREERWAAQATEDAKTEEERSEKWRRREGPSGRFTKTYVRLSQDGLDVETSRGAHVPLADAVQLFRLCEIHRRLGESNRNVPCVRHQVGAYRLEEINAVGDCKVGCHDLTFKEMERCYSDAKAEGLI